MPDSIMVIQWDEDKNGNNVIYDICEFSTESIHTPKGNFTKFFSDIIDTAITNLEYGIIHQITIEPGAK